jgi:hypothetical protein
LRNFGCVHCSTCCFQKRKKNKRCYELYWCVVYLFFRRLTGTALSFLCSSITVRISMRRNVRWVSYGFKSCGVIFVVISSSAGCLGPLRPWYFHSYHSVVP